MMEFNNTQLEQIDTGLLEESSDSASISKKLIEKKKNNNAQFTTADDEFRSQQQALGNANVTVGTGERSGERNEDNFGSSEYRVSTYQGETILSDTEDD